MDSPPPQVEPARLEPAAPQLPPASPEPRGAVESRPQDAEPAGPEPAAEPVPTRASEPRLPDTAAAPAPPSVSPPAWLKDLVPTPTPSFAAPEVGAARGAPTPGEIGTGEMERLRKELEAERALVDRLREAKLKLEQRAADAETTLQEQRSRRRSSVIGRLLKGDRESE